MLHAAPVWGELAQTPWSYGDAAPEAGRPPGVMCSRGCGQHGRRPTAHGGDALQTEPRELRMMPRLSNTVFWLQLPQTVRSPGFTRNRHSGNKKDEVTTNLDYTATLPGKCNTQNSKPQLQKRKRQHLLLVQPEGSLKNRPCNSGAHKATVPCLSVGTVPNAHTEEKAESAAEAKRGFPWTPSS